MSGEAGDGTGLPPFGAGQGAEDPAQRQFRYSRARRLAEAPESVRWLASRYGARREGFLKSLFATRASRLLFFTIVALVVAFNVVPLLEAPRSSARIGSDSYSAKAFWFEGRVFLSLSRTGPLVPEAERGTIAVRARAGQGEAAPSAEASFVVGLEEREDFRMSLEVPAGKPAFLSIRLAAGEAGVELRAKVE